MSGIQLIVGLANPGKEYADTRHNAGAWFIEKIAEQYQKQLRAESKYLGLHALISIDGNPCHLLIPTTYMNHSGQAVRACMNFYKIPANKILIAHDEIDLQTGSIKLKFDGGDGGHNGLRDIIRHLHTKQFLRLRIGVGRPKLSNQVVDYVLNVPSKSESKLIHEQINQSIEILPLLIEGHIQKAMHKLHTAT